MIWKLSWFCGITPAHVADVIMGVKVGRRELKFQNNYFAQLLTKQRAAGQVLGKCTRKDTAMREDVIKGKGWMRQHIYMQRITRNKQQVWEQLHLITGDRQIELNTRQTTKMKQEETEHGKRNSDMTQRQKDKQAPKQDWLHKKSQGTQGRRVKLI